MNKNQFVTKNCLNSRRRSRILEGRDHESFTKAKISFVHKRSVKVGLPCDGMLLDIQCCPLEIFAIKKTLFIIFWNSCVTQLMINCSKLAEVISNYPNLKELFL